MTYCRLEQLSLTKIDKPKNFEAVMRDKYSNKRAYTWQLLKLWLNQIGVLYKVFFFWFSMCHNKYYTYLQGNTRTFVSRFTFFFSFMFIMQAYADHSVRQCFRSKLLFLPGYIFSIFRYIVFAFSCLFIFFSITTGCDAHLSVSVIQLFVKQPIK